MESNHNPRLRRPVYYPLYYGGKFRVHKYSMDLINLLYTPLDLPSPPDYDPQDIINWINENKDKLDPYKKYAYDHSLSNERNEKVTWPWNMGLAFLNWDDKGPGWLCDFDKRFPDLSRYMHEVFGIPIEDLGTVVILPVSHTHQGMGFLHQDPGDFGIRIYLEFEHIGKNKLLMQRTRLPHKHRPGFPYPIDQKYLQPEVIECKTLTNKGCWYINNTRAYHGVWTEVENSTRIAVIVSGNKRTHNKIMERLTPIIQTSAEKYADYAVHWQGLSDSN
jgi:hypothetical protein